MHRRVPQMLKGRARSATPQGLRRKAPSTPRAHSQPPAPTRQSAGNYLPRMGCNPKAAHIGCGGSGHYMALRIEDPPLTTHLAQDFKLASRQMHEILNTTRRMLREGSTEQSVLLWATTAVSNHGRYLVGEETACQSAEVVADPLDSKKNVRKYTRAYANGMQVYMTKTSVRGGPSHALLCTDRWLRLKVMQQRYSCDNWRGHSMATYTMRDLQDQSPQANMCHALLEDVARLPWLGPWCIHECL